MVELSVSNIQRNSLSQTYSKISQNARYSNNNSADTFENSSAKKLSKRTKRNIIIGTAVTIGTIALLVLKGQFSKAAKLAENVDFVKASTIEEAIEFGKKHLGIKKYKDFTEKDLDAINWVNEGLVNVNNKMKGKAKLPKIVEAVEKDKDNCAYMICSGRRLGINKAFIEDLDNKLNTVINYKTASLDLFDKKTIKLLEKSIQDYKAGKLTSLNDKLELFNNLQTLSTEAAINPAELIKKCLANNEFKQKLIEKGLLVGENFTQFKLGEGFLIDISPEGLKKGGQIFSAISKIMQKETGSMLVHQTQSPFRTIYHELGHLNDKQIRPLEALGTGKIGFFDRIKCWGGNKDDFGTAYMVSEYAATSPSEFVAEVFAELMSGNKLPDEVMELYKRLGGPFVG